MIFAGVGFSSRCSSEELADLVRQALAAIDRTAMGLAAPARKVGAPCLRDTAALLRLPIHAVGPHQLSTAADRIVTHSAISRAATGVGSVAEAAALAAAGPGSRLALARISSAHATCALAEGDPS